MDIQTTKLRLLKTIMEIESLEVIKKVASFVKREQKDFWDELSLNQPLEIKKGVADLDAERRVSYEDVLKKIGRLRFSFQI
jgi:hypothetical protein